MCYNFPAAFKIDCFNCFIVILFGAFGLHFSIQTIMLNFAFKLINFNILKYKLRLNHIGY